MRCDHPMTIMLPDANRHTHQFMQLRTLPLRRLYARKQQPVYAKRFVSDQTEAVRENDPVTGA